MYLENCLTQERPRSLDSMLLDAQEIERNRLGQELHDSTSQLLVALRLSIAHFKICGPNGRSQFLNEIDAAASEIEQQIRAVTFLRCPPKMADAGLVATLRHFTDAFARRTGIRVFFRCDMPGTITDCPFALDLLRIAQEALTNVYRHARAGSVRIFLSWQDGLIKLSIKDDGRGMSDFAFAHHHDGVGMISMRRRAECNGGELKLRRRKKGTELLVVIPAN